jgi:ubiquinone/menaquinone biosynthesis C-methylase UbiE
MNRREEDLSDPVSGNQEFAGDPCWGAEHRETKAAAILQTLRQFAATDPTEGDWLDMGCGSGGIAVWLADRVHTMVGVDPEAWGRWDGYREAHPNLRFVEATAADSGIPDQSIDVVICNQVYEHVDDPQRLIGEIRRVLRPAGYCYFARPNLVFPKEPHVFWPFVHWLPRELARGLMKTVGAKKLVDANSKDYWTLKRWFGGFETTNAVPYILRNPALYGRAGFGWRFLAYVPEGMLRELTFLSPGFVFVLRK